MEVTLRGAVFRVNQARMTFGLQLVYGPEVAGPIPEQHYDTIIEAFNGYRAGVKALVRGTGSYDRQSRLSRLESVEQISILDPLDVPAQLDDFRGMRAGWLDGEGLAPSQAGLDWLADRFDRCYPNDVPLPYLYPTPEGGVQAEWSLGTREVSLNVNLSTHRAEWAWVDVLTDAEAERTLNLDDVADWNWFAAELRRMAEVIQ